MMALNGMLRILIRESSCGLHIPRSYDAIDFHGNITYLRSLQVLAPTVQIKLPIPADARPGIGNMFLVTGTPNQKQQQATKNQSHKADFFSLIFDLMNSRF